MGGKASGEEVVEIQIFLERLRGHQIEGLLNADPQIEDLFLQLQIARFDLGEVKDVVDDP